MIELKAKYHKLLEFVLSRSNHISVETSSEIFEREINSLTLHIILGTNCSSVCLHFIYQCLGPHTVFTVFIIETKTTLIL